MRVVRSKQRTVKPKCSPQILLTSALSSAFTGMVVKLISGILLMLALAGVGCHENKATAAAHANAVGYGLARCECEKLSKKEPPGDTTLCGQQMAQAERYLRINFEMGKFSEADRRAVQKAGDDAYEKCIKQ